MATLSLLAAKGRSHAMHYNLRLFWRTFYRSFFSSKNTPARLVKKRLIFLTLFYLVWPIGSLMHWFFFWLDDILFPPIKHNPSKNRSLYSATCAADPHFSTVCSHATRKHLQV